MAAKTQLVDVETLRADLSGPNPPRLLDVRTPAEFRTAHIPGAYNVPLDTLREHRDDLSGHLAGTTVLICRSGQRAAQADTALAGTGLANLAVLSGGMMAWQAAGAPVTAGRSRWELERQVRLVVGIVVLTSVLASTVVEPAKWVAAAMAAGLTFAALSNTCAMGMLLAKLPYNRGPRQDIATIVAELRGPAGTVAQAGAAG